MVRSRSTLGTVEGDAGASIVATNEGIDAGEPGARAFAWGVWGMLTIASAWLVAWYGSDVPIWDDYAIVPALVGERPITLRWLWEPCNEHRIALPKLILLAVGRLAGGDVRGGMALSVACLSATAGALIAMAGRLRGGGRASDAIYPLLLLHPGHATNLLWSIQLAFILPTALGTLFLIAIARRSAWPGPRGAWLAGSGLALLPLCGGTGLVFVPPMAAWLIASAWAEARSGRPGSGRRAAVVASAAGPGLALVVLYFQGFRGGVHPDSPGGIWDAARAGVQFLAGGLGMPMARAWPASGGATLGLLAMALVWLGRAWATRPGERPRVVGLLAFLGAMAAMAAAVGWGRGWAGDRAGFQDRYVTMAAPFWCWLAIAFRLYAPRAWGVVLGQGLFAVACLLLWPNAEIGLSHARRQSETAGALAREVRAGVPPFRLVRRFTPFLHPSQDDAAQFLPMLRRGGIGPFGALRLDPLWRETRLPVEPTALALARWDAATGTAHVIGVDPQITFAIEPSRPIAGIQIRYSHVNPQGGPARFRFAWKRAGAAQYLDTSEVSNWTLPTGDHRETTVWIDDSPAAFRIQPDNQPCQFRIEEIVLLEP